MSNGQTRFHVPTPPYRPGDEPDFSHLQLQKAGEAPRPDPATGWEETRDLATGLVGVLDHNHQAVGDWNPELSAEVLREGLSHMVLTRIYETTLTQLMSVPNKS